MNKQISKKETALKKETVLSQLSKKETALSSARGDPSDPLLDVEPHVPGPHETSFGTCAMITNELIESVLTRITEIEIL